VRNLRSLCCLATAPPVDPLDHRLALRGPADVFLGRGHDDGDRRRSERILPCSVSSKHVSAVGEGGGVGKGGVEEEEEDEEEGMISR